MKSHNKQLIFQILLVIGGFILGFLFALSIFADSDAWKLWSKIESACLVYEKHPEMEAVILPNGNIGYSINCK